MPILALDTSTELCSVAVGDGRDWLERTEHAGQRHSELLLPMVHNLLRSSGLELHRLDGIALGIGPGSFTGLRIGCGVAQGLGFAASLPIVGVPSLEAMAESERSLSGTTAVIASVDARMHEVYIAAYRYYHETWNCVLA